MVSALLGLPFILLQLAYAPIWDGPVPDISDWVPEAEEVPAKDNAYDVLLAFTQNHQEAPNDQLEKWVREPGQFSKEQMADIIRECEPYQLLLQEMRSKPFFQPRPNLKEKSLPTYKISRDLARLQRLRIRYALEMGRREEAMNLCIENIRFALFLSGNQGSLIDEMISSMILGMALDEAEFVVSRHPELPPSPLVRALLEVPDMRKTAWSSFQGEAQFMIHALDQSSKSPTFMQTGIVIFTLDFNAWWLNLPAPTFLFQRNNTVRLHLTSLKKWEHFLLAPSKEFVGLAPPPFEKVYAGVLNGIGSRVYNEQDLWARPIAVLLEKEAHAHALILMAFMSRGKRPPDDWVLDPFTGKPLQVSKDGTRIVSAGLDQSLGTDDDEIYDIPISIRTNRNTSEN